MNTSVVFAQKCFQAGKIRTLIQQCHILDTINGVVWLSSVNDVTIFKMPRTVENFKHWTKKQLSRAKPLLDISNKDK